MTINEKIIYFLDHKGISQRKFTLKAKLAEGVLRGGKSLGADKLIKINRIFPDLSMEWLLFDRGEMVLKEDYSQKPNLDIANEMDHRYEQECKNCESLEKLLEAKNETISILKHQLGIQNGGNNHSKAS